MPAAQETALQALWDVFDLSWGEPRDGDGYAVNDDEDPASPIPSGALAIENGSMEASPAASLGDDGASVATTQPEQTPDEDFEVGS